MKEILLKILDISKESYNQEISRSNNLLTKSDYLIKYISATFVLVNAIFVFLATNKVLSIFFLAGAYLIISAILCLGLFLSIRVQILKEAKYFPTGNTIIKEIKEDWNQEKRQHDETSLINKTINYYSDFIDKLEEVNNNRAKIISRAYKTYLGSIIVSSLVFFLCFMIIA